MSELKACPCGKIPSRLCISEPSQSKYQRCYGDCCNEWEIEFRADYLKLGDPKMYDMAVEAWNRMPRDTRPNDAKAYDKCPTCGHRAFTISQNKPDEWIRVEDEPKENGHYQIWDNGYGEGLFKDGEWKSTDRPIKNAMGVQCLRVTLHPTYYMPLPTPPKQSSEGEEG